MKVGTDVTKVKEPKRRLSDKEFWPILTANAGLYQRTAVAIQKKFNIAYTRQAVKDRAERKPEKLKEIQETNLDMAESGLFGLMASGDERVRQRAIEYYLDRKGKARGYIKQVNNALVDKDGENLSFSSFLMEASTIVEEEQ